jgi:phosphorylcholine metabolism protein LicD
MLDLFVMKPYDIKIKKYTRRLFQIAKLMIHHNDNLIKRVIKKIVYFLRLNKISQKILDKYEKKQIDNPNSIGMIANQGWYAKVFDYSHIFPLSTIEFEGYTFPCPGKPHDYLRSFFGETYMELPPIEKRRTHAKFIDASTPCKFQQKKLKNNKE